MEQYNEKGMAICQVCGKAFGLINSHHLKSHNLTFEDYKQQFPDSPSGSKSFHAKHKMKNIKIFEPNINDTLLEEDKITEEIKIEDINIEKIPIVSKEYVTKVSNFIEEVKNFTEEQTIKLNYPNPNNSIHKEKIKYLNFLLSYFGEGVINSYFVEKFNKTGSIEERLVTDIAIPQMKIDIEFPNTFWHNMDISKVSRDTKLKLLGWKIIDIPGAKPNIDNFKDILKKFKII